jgi:hypothetical protein
MNSLPSRAAGQTETASTTTATRMVGVFMRSTSRMIGR